MPDYSAAYQPVDASSAIKSGIQWAQQKKMNQYRQEELKRQYAQIQSQQDIHKMQTMSKFMDGFQAVVAAPKEAQPGVFKIWSAQAKQLFPQMDTDGFKNLLKDPDVMNLDSVAALRKTLQAMGAAPDKSQRLAQGMTELKAATSDPLLFRQLVGSVTKQYEQQENQQKNQTSIGDRQIDVATAKNALPPSAAKTSQDASKDVTTYQKMLDTQDYRKASGVINDIGTTRDLIQSAQSGNGISLNMLPVGVAKLFVAGAGRLNQAEIKAAGGSKAITTQIGQAFDQMTQGKLSDQNAKLMNQLADVMEQGAVQKKFDIENSVAKQYSQKSGLSIEDSYQKLTGGKYPGSSSDDEDEEKSALDSMPADQKAKLSDWIAKHKAAGTSDDDIKSQIKKSKLGLDLSDDDYDSLAPKDPAQQNQPAPQPSQAPLSPQAAPSAPQTPTSSQAPVPPPMPQQTDEGNQ